MPNTQPESYSRAGVEFSTWDTGADILDEPDYSAITKAVLGDAASGFLASDFYLTLKARHLMYSHSHSGIPQFHNGEMIDPGDCNGGSTDLSGVQNEMIGIKVANLGTAAAGTIYTLAATDPEPVTKAVIAGIGAVVSFIGGEFAKHHAQAIALEQRDICAAALRVNVLLDQIDSEYYAGSVSADQAGAALKNARDAYEQIVQPVQTGQKPSLNKRACNAACAELSYLDGLIYMRVHYLYPRQAPNPVTSTINNAASSINKAVSANPALAIGVGILLLITILLATGRKVAVVK